MGDKIAKVIGLPLVVIAGIVAIAIVVVQPAWLQDIQQQPETSSGGQDEPASAPAGDVYSVCREQFVVKLLAPADIPIHQLINGNESLLADPTNPNNGAITNMPDGSIILAGQAEVEIDDDSRVTRGFTCIVNADGTLKDFAKGQDSTWGR